MLSDRERHALELAATPYRYPAVRETRVRDELGLTPTAYWSLVDGLLDRADALEEMPAAVARLRRVREARAAVRAAARRGPGVLTASTLSAICGTSGNRQ